MISLDEFVAAANACKKEEDAFALVMRGDENGTAEVRAGLRPETCVQRVFFRQELLERRCMGIVVKWIGSAVRLLQFESDFSAPGANEQMPRVLMNENSVLLLSEAEKRGLDVRLWDRNTLMHSLLYPRVMAWLHERVDLEARVSPAKEFYHPVFDSFETYDGRVKCLRTLLELRCFAMANTFGPKILSWKETDVWGILRRIKKGQIDRFLCLEGGGIVLAILFSHTPPVAGYQRRLRETLAARAKITASDFASAGLKMPAGPN